MLGAIIAGLCATLAGGCVAPNARADAGSAARPFPVQVRELVRDTPDGPQRGWVARVDLTDARVAIRVSGPAERRADDPPEMEVRAETTPDWLARERLVLAVNTHFFARMPNDDAPLAAGTPLDLIGPCVADGRLVSPAPSHASPGLALSAERTGRVAMLSAADLAGMDDVVAGTSGGKGKGGLLVADGRNVGTTALPQPQKRHPRTAAGLTADGQTLLLVVVDGRQPDWSIGMTLPELGELLIELGAGDAVNLDGGGSSSFMYAPPGGAPLVNRPSDGRWRPVGASLGVDVREN
jgi:exopolysaccharide biosynthesis protein